MSFGSFGGNQDHVCYIQLWWFFLFLVCWANVLLQPKTRETIKSLHYCIDRKHPTHQPSSAGLSLPPPIPIVVLSSNPKELLLVVSSRARPPRRSPMTSWCARLFPPCLPSRSKLCSEEEARVAPSSKRRKHESTLCQSMNALVLIVSCPPLVLVGRMDEWFGLSRFAPADTCCTLTAMTMNKHSLCISCQWEYKCLGKHQWLVRVDKVLQLARHHHSRPSHRGKRLGAFSTCA